MVVGRHFMLQRIFLDAHTGAYEKKDDQRLGEEIHNTRQNHEGHMIGLKNVEINDALDKSSNKE